jgi:competence protein ComEC
MSRHVRTLTAVLAALLVCACEQPPSAPPPGPKPSPTLARRYFGRPADGKLHVYFFDVGQGDAVLIISPTGRTVLVDAGPTTAGTHLANRLPELLTDKLDLVVLTHPHPDHYSGLAAAVGAVGARKLLEPQLPHTPSGYDALLTSLAGNGVEVFSPSPPSADEPLRLPLGGDTELTVLWPRAPTEPLLVGESAQELNSIVLRLTYKDTAVLLAGDARERTESHLLERKVPMRATLLKVGAHGDSSASSAPFLDAVHPGAAIISTGVNPRGTPMKAVLDRMVVQKVRVFRTDREGEVHAISDGQRFTLTTQRRPAGTPAGTSEVFAGFGDSSGQVPVSGKAQYVAIRNSRHFHLPECRSVRRLKEKNLLSFVNRDEALAQHYEPARDCKP